MKENNQKQSSLGYVESFSKLYLEASDIESGILRLNNLIEVLRQECPWDREQTHESLRSCMLEEAYEACDAIDRADWENLEEELGDVMLQVVFHSQLGIEEGRFSLISVLNRVCDKMISRHPHVFCGETVKGIDKALEKWENVKKKEKGVKTSTSRLLDVPIALPALLRSKKLQARAAEVGFDWDDVIPAFEKIKEEAEELRQAYAEANKAEIEKELGDLLFSVVNVARFLGVDPEQALNGTSDRFIKRFSFMERATEAQNKPLESLSLEEMDVLWELAKIEEHKDEKK